MAYTTVDDFNRADSVAGGVGNGWADLLSAYRIDANRLYTGSPDQFLIRTGDTFISGKRRLKIHRADNTGNAIDIFLRGSNIQSGTGKPLNYVVLHVQGDNGLRVLRFCENGTITDKDINGGALPDDFYMEIAVDGDAATGTIYEADGVTVNGTPLTTSGVNALSPGAGIWGIPGCMYGAHIDQVDAYANTTPSTAVTVSGPGRVNRKSPYAFTVGLDGSVTADTVVSLALSGVTGTVSPSTVTLTQGAPVANVTVTPTSEGNGTVTGTAASLTPGTTTFAVKPPLLTVVCLGDSNYAYNVIPPMIKAILNAWSNPIRDHQIVNLGIGGKSSYNARPEANGGDTGWLQSVVDAVNAAPDKVVVSIMLGTNDARNDILTPPATFKANILLSIDYIIAHCPGADYQIVLQYAFSPTPLYNVQGGNWSNGITLIPQYHAKIDEILADSTRSAHVKGASKAAYLRFYETPDGLLADAQQIHVIASQAGAATVAIAQAQGIAPALGLKSGFGGAGITSGITIHSLGIGI